MLVRLCVCVKISGVGVAKCVCVGALASCRQRRGEVLCVVPARKVKEGESHAPGGDDSDDAREHDVRKVMQN